MNIPVFNTYINPAAFDFVSEVLNSTFLSEGSGVKQFEEEFAKEFKLNHLTALNSGTSALHLALVLAGVKPGDEVICPAQTFVASALSVLYEKAVPVFADIQYKTGNISPTAIEQKISENTKAIMVVHWGGYPCDMDEIHAIAKKHNLIVIEDAAHALGATYKGRTIGTLSDYTCFSFQAIKHLTTGDGGGLCSTIPEKVEEAITRRWFGINRATTQPSFLGERQYDIGQVGYKYHLNDYAAALGLANLQGIHDRLALRRKYAKMYVDGLKNIKGLNLFQYKEDRESAYWLFGIHAERRDNFIKALQSRGITASVIHQRIDRNSVFGGLRKELVNQEKFDSTQVHIPMHDALSEEKVSYIIESIKKGW